MLLQQLPGDLYEGHIDGMLLDLGVSSMQVSSSLCALALSVLAIQSSDNTYA